MSVNTFSETFETSPSIADYFFMRSFVNGKTFKGYMVGIDHRGQVVAREMGFAMNRVARELGLRMFKSISPENPASLAVTKKVNNKIGFVSPERRYEAPTVVRPPQM